MDLIERDDHSLRPPGEVLLIALIVAEVQHLEEQRAAALGVMPSAEWGRHVADRVVKTLTSCGFAVGR